MTEFCDVLIIGSGAAGLTAALNIAPSNKIVVLSKGFLTSASTYYAQGGVAAVLDETDTTQAHIHDTLAAGAGLCSEKAVRYTVENGPKVIEWLVNQGVRFSLDENHSGLHSHSSADDPNSTASQPFHLTKEGGHSHRRVIHVADATGVAISTTLIKQVQGRSNIHLQENSIAIDLITSSKMKLPGNRCLGAYVLDKTTGNVVTFQARYTILATGGASKVYLYTSNPDVATGDGIAMAWRAGCRVANLEFNQFHPTCLYHPAAKSFLITEAIRGEGGILRLPNGERFMPRFHPQAELAPRDIVARAIDHEMKRLGLNCVYLDISHQPESFLREHFPTVFEKCEELGFDLSKEPIPVVPAAHYTCGGVVTNLKGQTDVEGLYVVGETACTGLHGANRMASNSLLECMVFAFGASEDINTKNHIMPSVEIPEWDASRVTDSDEDVVISHNWDELRRFMWDYVGIVRTDKRLQRAKHRVDLLRQEITEYYSNYKVTGDLIELRNLVLVADLIICCALQRKESRGLHYTLDYPYMLPVAHNTVLTPFNAVIKT